MISSAHLPEEAMLYLEGWDSHSAPRQTGLLFELFAVPDYGSIGCKLIGTPWTDENLLDVVSEGKPYSILRQEQFDAGTQETLNNVLYLAALVDVRLLIFDPDSAVLDGLDVFDESNAFDCRMLPISLVVYSAQHHECAGTPDL